MDAEGTGLNNLTKSPADDIGPIWSLDGRQIVFSIEELQDSSVRCDTSE